MTIIGITGGTGAGKTTALRVLTAFGAHMIDCDALYHELLVTDKEMLRELDARFPGVVEDGVLQRKKLGAIVFGDEKALLDLNRITHAYIRKSVEETILREKEKGTPVVAIDAIALLESGIGELCDFTVGIIAPEEVRIKRIMLRENISEKYARLRVSAQKSNAYFRSVCDYTLENACDTMEAFEVVCTEFFDQKLKEERK